MKNLPKEIIEGTASAIMQSFIPKDKDVAEFSFHFTIPPSHNFKATYKLDAQKVWRLSSCLPATSES